MRAETVRSFPFLPGRFYAWVCMYLTPAPAGTCDLDSAERKWQECTSGSWPCSRQTALHPSQPGVMAAAGLRGRTSSGPGRSLLLPACRVLCSKSWRGAAFWERLCFCVCPSDRGFAVFYSVDMVHYIHWFSAIKPTSHFWNKYRLVLVWTLFWISCWTQFATVSRRIFASMFTRDSDL